MHFCIFTKPFFVVLNKHLINELIMKTYQPPKVEDKALKQLGAGMNFPKYAPSLPSPDYHSLPPW